MKEKNSTILKMTIFLLFFISVSIVRGQGTKNFALKGSKEFGGNISYQRITPIVSGSKSGFTSIFSFSPYIGVFLKNGFEIGMNPFDVIAITQLGSTTSQVFAFIVPSYNFRFDDKIYPFIEAQFGFGFKSNKEYSEKGFSWGGRTGFKVALTKSGLINLSLKYLRVTLNPKDAPDRFGFNQLLVSVGWTVWL